MNLIAERKVDELGRLVLPAEIRQKQGITPKSTIKIYEKGEQIILEKSEPSCKLCGNDEKIIGDFVICVRCVEKIKQY